MSRDTPIHHWPILIVTIGDGTQFTCSAYQVRGAEGATEVRWQLTDSKGRDHVGPTCVPGESPAQVQRRVAEWWDEYRRHPDVALP
jgi:hypothetical protein